LTSLFIELIDRVAPFLLTRAYPADSCGAPKAWTPDLQAQLRQKSFAARAKQAVRPLVVKRMASRLFVFWWTTFWNSGVIISLLPF
jgi:hypothetical protein